MRTVLVFSFLVSCILAQDYCWIEKNLCNGKRHIGCGNNESKCNPANTQYVKFNKTQRNAIVRMHNKLRNRIAGGDIDGFLPAARMATMKWDTELAYLAFLNGKRCIYEHDECRKTLKYNFAGQNIASFTRSNPVDIMVNTKAAIDKWFQEYKLCNMDYIDIFPGRPVSKAIGHFATLARDKNIAFGCAAVAFNNGGIRQIIVVCNYATTVITGNPIYTSSAEAAVDCETGINPQFTNLCSVSEVFTFP